MKTIFSITLKSALKDPFLLFWSLIVPIAGCVILKLLVKTPDYSSRIMIGMTASSVLFYALITTAFAVMAQRRRGVYHLLKITAMPLWQYIFSLSSAKTIISIICGLIVTIFCSIVFGFMLSISSILLILPVILTASLGFVFLSFFIASLTNAEEKMSMITNIILMPLLFCSDAYYPLDKAPIFLKRIANWNPFQLLIHALRHALERDISQYLLNLLFLTLFLSISFLLALKTFKYSNK